MHKENKMNTKYLFLNLLIGALLFACFGLASCASTPSGRDLQPDGEYGVIAVRRTSNLYGSAVGFDIYIDGTKAGSVRNNSSSRLRVENGHHTIQIRWGRVQSPILSFTANSNELHFTTSYTVIGVAYMLQLNATQ